MGAHVTVGCAVKDCTYITTIRIDPPVDNDNITAAEQELIEEHPNHDGKSWKFLVKEYQ